MSIFSCKICAEKDKRIADLKEQIRFLQPDNHPDNVPAVSYEADGVLSGQQHIIEIPDAEAIYTERRLSEAEDERSERDRILSGTY